MRSPASALSVAALVALAIGCTAVAPDEPSPAAAPPPARVAPAPTPSPAPAPTPVSRARPDDMGPGERGETFCCGRGSLKIEIACRDMQKTCYRKDRRGWRATYGRHCKRALGQGCYLDGCDARC